jgi:Zn finger protein HypA/HybF involved in hydrogenase expression
MTEPPPADPTVPDRQVMCPTCATVFVAEPEWRIARCPQCGGMITRMAEDNAFD